jgi:hypothetical protein
MVYTNIPFGRAALGVSVITIIFIGVGSFLTMRIINKVNTEFEWKYLEHKWSGGVDDKTNMPQVQKREFQREVQKGLELGNVPMHDHRPGNKETLRVRGELHRPGQN